MKKSIFTALTIFIFASAFSQQKWNYPATPKITVYDTIWGKVIQDDYRWMEDTKDPRFLDWLMVQKAFTDSVMSLVPGQAQLAAEFKAAYAQNFSSYFQIQKLKDYWIYRKSDPNDAFKDSAFIRKGLNGKEEFWFDSHEQFSSKGQVLRNMIPFPSGNFVMLDVVDMGTEISHLQIAAMPSGKILSDSISGFMPKPIEINGEAFVAYYHLPVTDVRDPNFFQSAKLSLYKIGSNSKPIELFNKNDYPELKDVETHYATISSSGYSKNVVLIFVNGATSEVKTYFAEKGDLLKPGFKWKPLNAPFIMPRDGSAYHIKGDHFFYATDLSNPNGEIRMTSFSQASGNNNTVVFTPPEGWILNHVSMSSEYLLITTTKNALTSKVYKYKLSDGKIALKLKQDGIVDFRPFDKEALLFRSAWAGNADAQLIDINTGVFKSAFFTSKSTSSSENNLVVMEVEVKSHDGVMVPLSIIYDKTKVKKDGTNPVYLHGYGSFGYSIIPSSTKQYEPILKRGMIYAVAHVRGGGEKGATWQQAAMKEKKTNAWKDFHACAEYLIAQGYTSKGKIIAHGGSAGGVLTGRAITDRPDLYGAADIRVGSLNTMRQEFSPNGMSAMYDHGTVKVKEEADGLLAMDSYHNTTLDTPLNVFFS